MCATLPNNESPHATHHTPLPPTHDDDDDENDDADDDENDNNDDDYFDDDDPYVPHITHFATLHVDEICFNRKANRK